MKAYRGSLSWVLRSLRPYHNFPHYFIKPSRFFIGFIRLLYTKYAFMFFHTHRFSEKAIKVERIHCFWGNCFVIFMSSSCQMKCQTWNPDMKRQRQTSIFKPCRRVKTPAGYADHLLRQNCFDYVVNHYYIFINCF